MYGMIIKSMSQLLEAAYGNEPLITVSLTSTQPSFHFTLLV